MIRFVCPGCKGGNIYENNVVHVRLKVKEWHNTDPDALEFGEPADFEYPWKEVDDTIRTTLENEAPRGLWQGDGCVGGG